MESSRKMADEVEHITEEVVANDVETSMSKVIRNSMAANGLFKGLRECVKCLVRGQGQLCIFATDTKEDGYTKLIRALCNYQKVNMIDVPSREALGQLVGLYKSDKDGNAREGKKIVGCSCVVIHNFGLPSKELDFLLKQLKQ